MSRDSKDITDIIIKLKRWKKRSLTRIIPSSKKHDKKQNTSVQRVLVRLSKDSSQSVLTAWYRPIAYLGEAFPSSAA